MKKDHMFQYATDFDWTGIKFYEDTGLITEAEALVLWDKYYPQVVKELQEGRRPQMCIWRNCDSETDYGDMLKEVDWRDDLIIKHGKIFKRTATMI